jgi:hypothetical protein
MAKIRPIATNCFKYSGLSQIFASIISATAPPRAAFVSQSPNENLLKTISLLTRMRRKTDAWLTWPD